MTHLTKAAIKAMSYQERLKRYHAEKDELLRRCGSLPAEEYQKRLDELIKKWEI